MVASIEVPNVCRLTQETMLDFEQQHLVRIQEELQSGVNRVT